MQCEILEKQRDEANKRLSKMEEGEMTESALLKILLYTYNMKSKLIHFLYEYSI